MGMEETELLLLGESLGVTPYSLIKQDSEMWGGPDLIYSRDVDISIEGVN